jgi:hypothetical protein
MTYLHINRPRSWSRRRIVCCPIDQRRTECVVTVYVWYSPRIQCARCGEGWEDGVMFERPFARGWRKAAQRRVRALWDVTPYGPFPTLEAMEAVLDPHETERPVGVPA